MNHSDSLRSASELAEIAKKANQAERARNFILCKETMRRVAQNGYYSCFCNEVSLGESQIAELRANGYVVKPPINSSSALYTIDWSKGGK